MILKQSRYILAIAAAGVLLSGCGGGGGNGSKGIPPISSVNPVQTGTLEFAVGTANLFGTKTGLNVVSTYRQADGLSNVLLDTPTITGPFTLPTAAAFQGSAAVDSYSTVINAADNYITPSDAFFGGTPPNPGGPSISEIASGAITGTSQLIPLGTPTCDQTTPCTATNNATGGTGTVAPNTTTFGQAGGVFVNGLSPGNSTTQGVAASYIPYVEPLYDNSNTATQMNTFLPWGGPPAFDPNKDNMGLRDGLSNLGAGVVGIPEGFTIFENVAANAGTYTMSLLVPTGFNGSTPASATVSATAKLSSVATLPSYTAGTLPTLALDGKGGGTVTVPAMPAGVIEEYVQIVDFGANDGAPNPATYAAYPTCQGVRGPQGVGPVYYTIIVKAAGTYQLPDTDGPNTSTSGGTSGLTPSPSICTAAQNSAATSGSVTVGDSYTVQTMGLDYDMYGATYPITTSASPTLTGANGQADITVSAPSAVQVSP